jgi:hypothetical protein
MPVPCCNLILSRVIFYAGLVVNTLINIMAVILPSAPACSQDENVIHLLISCQQVLLKACMVSPKEFRWRVILSVPHPKFQSRTNNNQPTVLKLKKENCSAHTSHGNSCLMQHITVIFGPTSCPVGGGGGTSVGHFWIFKLFWVG